MSQSVVRVTVARREIAHCASILVGAAVMLLGPLAFPVEAAEKANPARPNILWIVGENFTPDFGCYGGSNVRTPNVDRLAAAGVRYTHAFSTSSVCAPSRSAFMTGMYQTSIDVHNMRSHREDDFRPPPGVRLLTHWLADAGYFTANISTIGEREVGTGKLDLNFVNEGPIYMSDDWSALKSNQPFFAQINTPEAEYDIYDRKSAEKPRVPWVGEEGHPKIATPDNVTLHDAEPLQGEVFPRQAADAPAPRRRQADGSRGRFDEAVPRRAALSPSG